MFSARGLFSVSPQPLMQLLGLAFFPAVFPLRLCLGGQTENDSLTLPASPQTKAPKPETQT